MPRAFRCFIVVFLLAPGSAGAGQLPTGFAYLRGVAPGILQDMRYAGPDNFIGRPVPGYEAAECVLQVGVADALKCRPICGPRAWASRSTIATDPRVRPLRFFNGWSARQLRSTPVIIPECGERGCAPWATSRQAPTIREVWLSISPSCKTRRQLSPSLTTLRTTVLALPSRA